MPRLMRLNGTVMPGHDAATGDLGQVRWAMSRLGLYDPARERDTSASLMSPGLQEALGVFQGGQGLRRDATLRPGGPTEERVNALIAEDRGLRVTDSGDGPGRKAREDMPSALAGRVGRGLENHPEDVALVGGALRRLGLIGSGASDPPGLRSVRRGLQKLQGESGLKQDGIIAPDGPTEREMIQRHAGLQSLPLEQTEASATTAEQSAALRTLDRFIHIDRGEPLDTGSDPAGTAFILQDYADADQETRARIRAFYRDKAAGRTPPTEEERRDARWMVHQFELQDQGETPDTSAWPASRAFILNRYSEASPEERAREKAFYRNRAGPDLLDKPLPSDGGNESDAADRLFRRKQTPLLPDQPLKGTAFFPGAGMAGDYVPDVIAALEEAGIRNVSSVDPDTWSRGWLLDLAGVPTERERDVGPSDFTQFGTGGEQFNLIGYSYGGLQAAQAAADYADMGGRIDHVVLIGTPIDGEFLSDLRNHPNIGAVEVIDLQEHGDPVRAGADFEEFGSSLPELADQSVGLGRLGDLMGWLRGEARAQSTGHFYYTGDGPEAESQRRRRALARQLYEAGLR